MHLTSVLDVTNACAAGKTLKLLGNVPQSLEAIIISLQSAFTFGLVRSAAGHLRKTALSNIDSVIPAQDQLNWLIDNNYNREETRQIRYVVEIFHHLEPVFLVMLSLAGRIANLRFESSEKISFKDNSGQMQVVKSEPIEHLDIYEKNDCLSPVIERYGTPSPLFFRSLAVWPSFMEKIWDDIERNLDSAEYIVAVDNIFTQSRMLALQIPIDSCLPLLRDENWAAAIQKALIVSSEVTLIASALRRSFIRTEIASRNRRAISMW